MSATATLSVASLPLAGAAAPHPQAAHAAPRCAWEIAKGQAMSLRAAGQSLLGVRAGRLWITRDATARDASEDLVLGPGESLRVARGERLVLEPWDGGGAAFTWEAVRG